MTREEQAARREAMRQMYLSGVCAAEVAERFGVSRGYVVHVSGGSINRPSIIILRERSGEVYKMLGRGLSYAEVGREFGVTKDVVRQFCKENGISRGSIANSEDDAARKIHEKSGGLLEYISGYTVKERPVLVRCTVCGGEFERTFHNLTTKGGVTCPHCVARERTQKKVAEAKSRNHAAMERKRKAEERKAEAEARAKEREHDCPVCGTVTAKPKYCSAECRRKANNKARETRRREKIQAVLKDADITVPGLYKRDCGVCYLCGGRCNLEDYTVRDGVFIAGDWYPSVDHVIPLVAGGEHSWDNVRLAHRRCNSIKGGRYDDSGETQILQDEAMDPDARGCAEA